MPGALRGHPIHEKSYQLGVLATPVQIRTDPSILATIRPCEETVMHLLAMGRLTP